MKNPVDNHVSWVACGTAALILLAGCSMTARQGGRTGLARLAFPSASLPRDVSIAPWEGGSDKLPWMTSNPFGSKDERVISEFEDGKIAEKGSVREVFLVAYWAGKPEESPVEIDVTALRFTDPATAARAAKAMQAEIDEDAELEPQTAQALLHQGSVVCILGRTSAVDGDVWSAMVRLAENALAEMP